MGLIKSGFPTGFKLNVTSMIAEDNKVAAEVVSEGKHKNGKEYNNKYHFLFEIEQGKIISVKEYMDTLHLFHLIQL
jgi:ketosteroid isomerase-like protein